MTISAHAPVPAGSRLIDADTADLAVIRRTGTNPGRFPVNPPRPAPAADGGSDDRYAQGYADGLHRAFTGNSPVELGRQAYQLMYDHRAKTLPDLVAALHASEQTVLDGIAAFIKEQTGYDLSESVAADPAAIVCPVWCTRDHTGEVTEMNGFTIGTLHERILVELTGQDPAYTKEQAAALVMVERSDEADVVTSPERIVLALAAGPEAQYVGSEGVQGWTGTPEQAEALAAALIEAARIARTAR